MIIHTIDSRTKGRDFWFQIGDYGQDADIDTVISEFEDAGFTVTELDNPTTLTIPSTHAHDTLIGEIKGMKDGDRIFLAKADCEPPIYFAVR